MVLEKLLSNSRRGEEGLGGPKLIKTRYRPSLRGTIHFPNASSTHSPSLTRLFSKSPCTRQQIRASVAHFSQGVPVWRSGSNHTRRAAFDTHLTLSKTTRL